MKNFRLKFVNNNFIIQKTCRRLLSLDYFWKNYNWFKKYDSFIKAKNKVKKLLHTEINSCLPIIIFLEYNGIIINVTEEESFNPSKILFKITDSNYRSIYAEGRYRISYPPRSTVTITNDTMGPLFYDSMDDVKMNYEILFRNFPVKILVIKALDRISKPLHRSIWSNEKSLDRFYDSREGGYYITNNIYKCSRKFKVLDDITEQIVKIYD